MKGFPNFLKLFFVIPLLWSLIAPGQAGAPTPVAPYSPQETVVVVEDPTLDPAYNGDMCGSAWFRFNNDRGHYAYLTLNSNTPPQAGELRNSAQWRPTLPVAGKYRVEAYIAHHLPVNWQCPSLYIDWDTSDARYQIHHADGETTASRNQAPLDNSWLDLGTYRFEAGAAGWVNLGDYNGEASLSRTISFSALRFILVETPPPPAGNELVEEPTIHPSYGNGMCDSAWHRFTNNRGHSAYLTLSTNSAAQSTNWAEWRPTVKNAGWYRVEAYVADHAAIQWQCPSVFLNWDTTDAHYTIHHADGAAVAIGNQAPLVNDWLNLGVYRFEAGTSGWVELHDLNAEANWSHSVSFSALRFVPVSSPPTPPPPPTVSFGQKIAAQAKNQTGVPYDTSRNLFCGAYGPWKAQNSVCTDLVIDAYLLGTDGTGPNPGGGCGASVWWWMRQHQGGYSLEELVYNDSLAHPGRYRYASARNVGDLLTYMQTNEIFLAPNQTWEVGDIAFFDWYGDGTFDHVAVVTSVSNGSPAAIMHAHGNPELCGGLACEQPWNSYYSSYTVGHARLKTRSAKAAAEAQQVEQAEVWQGVFLRLDSGSASDVLTFVDAQGRYVSNHMDRSQVANPNQEAIPYLPYAYPDDGDQQEILAVHPALGKYTVRVHSGQGGEKKLALTALKTNEVLQADQRTWNSQTGEDWEFTLEITNVDANIHFILSNPTRSSMLTLPEQVRGTANMKVMVPIPVRVSLSSSATGAKTIQLSHSALTHPLGDVIPDSQISWSVDKITLQPGETTTAFLQITPPAALTQGEYSGLILVKEDGNEAGARLVQVFIQVTAPLPGAKLYLPLVLR